MARQPRILIVRCHQFATWIDTAWLIQVSVAANGGVNDRSIISPGAANLSKSKGRDRREMVAPGGRSEGRRWTLPVPLWRRRVASLPAAPVINS